MGERAPGANEIKAEIVDAARHMLTTGLVEGTAGNLSAQLPGDQTVTTPSSLDYQEMGVDDLVVLDPNGQVIEGDCTPTTEKALHLACLNAHADVGGEVPVADYRLTGSAMRSHGTSRTGAQS